MRDREHILLDRQVVAPRIVKCDVVDDAELLDLVGLDVRELLSNYEFEGDHVPTTVQRCPNFAAVALILANIVRPRTQITSFLTSTPSILFRLKDRQKSGSRFSQRYRRTVCSSVRNCTPFTM